MGARHSTSGRLSDQEKLTSSGDVSVVTRSSKIHDDGTPNPTEFMDDMSLHCSESRIHGKGEVVMITVGILSISTKGAAGQREDTSGEAIRELVSGPPLAATVSARMIVPDDHAAIELALRHWADDLRLSLVLTTGGTGLSPTDVTPEATLAVVDRLAPGLAEAMRMETLPQTRFAMLSRAVAGCRGATLIVNLPGSPKGVRECLGVILPVLPHAVQLLTGHQTEHAPGDTA
jgi:molybdopterin adenylyltransferase